MKIKRKGLINVGGKHVLSELFHDLIYGDDTS